MSQRPYASDLPPDDTSQPAPRSTATPERAAGAHDETGLVGPFQPGPPPAPRVLARSPLAGAADTPYIDYAQQPTRPHSSGQIPPLQQPPPSRSLGMQAILNPQTRAPPFPEPFSHQSISNREPLESPSLASVSASTHHHGTLSPSQLPPQSSFRLQQYEGSPISPNSHRRMLDPKSPAARKASIGSVGRQATIGGVGVGVGVGVGAGVGSVGVGPASAEAGSKMVKSDTFGFPYLPPPPDFTAEPSPRLNIDSGSSTVPTRRSQHRQRQPLHAASIFHDPRATNPQSQESSPHTPQSASYAPFRQASPPAMPPPHLQIHPQSQPAPGLPPAQHQQPSPISGQLTGGPPPSRSMISHENRGQFRAETGFPTMSTHVALETGQGLIPVTIDMDSGSLKAKRKREKNSYASKRFRERKKAVEMEQTEALQRQADTIKMLKEERDYYKNERNFFRDLYSHSSDAQVIQRPQSPRLSQKRSSNFSESEGEITSVEPEGGSRGGGVKTTSSSSTGRNVRQRTSSDSVNLPYPPTSGSFSQSSPSGHTTLQQQSPRHSYSSYTAPPWRVSPAHPGATQFGSEIQSQAPPVPSSSQPAYSTSQEAPLPPPLPQLPQQPLQRQDPHIQYHHHKRQHPRHK
ncbi:hypothetical protein FQN57_007030 [Myotisia sp. PD_48]|nr:hypothetical protein FQN57_007030 [Myotisia sp. PD_48]